MTFSKKVEAFFQRKEIKISEEGCSVSLCITSPCMIYYCVLGDGFSKRMNFALNSEYGCCRSCLPIQMLSWMHKRSHQWVICTFSHEKKICMPYKDLKVEHLAFSVAPQFCINVFSSLKGLFLKPSDHHGLDTTFTVHCS